MMIRESPDQKVNVIYLRNGKKESREIQLKSKGLVKPKGFLGVRIEPAQKDMSLYRKNQSRSLLEGLTNGMQDCMRFLIIQFSTIYLLCTGTLSVNMLGGPVIIIAQTFQLFDLNNLVYLLNWVAIVNISLAFINILPIPIFDGGRLLMVSIESLKGKPLRTTTVNMIDRITFAALLGLAAMVTFNDIIRVLGIAP
jgi:regulator of sigma E protease